MNLSARAWTLLRNLIARFREDDVPSLGAQLSYYLILSFFPFLIFVLSLLGYARLSQDDLMDMLLKLLPSDTGESVRGIVEEVTSNRSGTLLSFGLLGSIWTASGGVNAMIKGLNKAYDEEENRPFWKVRGLALASTLVLAAVILVSMVLLVFGKTIEEHAFEKLGVPDNWWKTWNVVQFTVPVLALFLVFLLLYRMTPNRRLTWREVMPGSVFASAGWIVSSLLFSFYVNNFGHYSKTYGSVGGIIVLLIWLYITSIIVLLGGELNAALVEKRERR